MRIRFSYTIIFVFIYNVSFTQTRFGKVKCDSFQTCLDTTIALIYRKSKTGVYNKEFNEFFIRPTKKKIIYPEESDILFVIDKNKLLFYDLLESGQRLKRRPLVAESQIEVNTSFSKDTEIILDEKPFEVTSWPWRKEQLEIKKGQDPIKSIRREFIPEFDRQIAIKKYNDSLLIITNYKYEFIDPFSTPLKSLKFPEEDSIIQDLNGNYVAVYPPNELSHSTSGVYNAKTKKWLIEPTYAGIHEISGGFLFVDFTLNENKEQIGVDYSFFSLVGGYSFHNKTAAEFSENKKYLKSVFGASQLIELSNSNEIDDKNRAAYLKVENGYIAYQKEADLISFSAPKEMIHYNPKFEYFIWLEGDSLFIEIDNKQYGVKKENGGIALSKKIENDFYYGNTAYIENIKLFNEKDTSLYIPMDIEWSDNGEKELIIKCNEAGNRIIINGTGEYSNIAEFDQILIEEGTYEELSEDFYFRYSIESSAVWEKESDGWVKKTPYFAEIQEVPFGYLATTGNSIEITKFPYEEKKIDQSKVLLDSQYNPIPYLDFYDFQEIEIYDFGVKVCPNSACFLVDNTGKPITDMNWDDFELENNQIKAIKYKTNWENFYEDDDPTAIIDEVKYYDWNP